MRRLCIFCAALFAAAVFFQSTPIRSSANTEKFRRSASPVPNSYIAVLDETENMTAEGLVKTSEDLKSEFHGNIRHDFSDAISGYSVEMSEKQARALSQDPRVKYVEEDSWIDVQASQSDATWGISRIDQPNFQYPLD